GRDSSRSFGGPRSVYLDDASGLVQPEAAQRQIDEDRARAEAARAATQDEPDPPTDGTKVVPPPAVTEPERPVLTRYFGAVSVDPQRVNREMGLIVEEVIQRLTSLTGCEVEIHLEITARRPEGFDEATVRTISENSRTLKFSSFDFD